MMIGRAHSPNFRACKPLQFLTVALCIALCTGQAAAQQDIDELPSAPKPQLKAETSGPAWFQFSTPDDLVPLHECPYDQTGARECRVHWHQLVISTSVFIAFLNAGNLYTGYWYRCETTRGKWFDRWINSAAEWQWNRWSDSNPVLDE